MTQQNNGSSYGSELAAHENGEQNTMDRVAGGHSHAAGKETIDAGLLSLDHCTFSKRHNAPLQHIPSAAKRRPVANPVLLVTPDRLRLPPWRYWLRAQLLPLIRWETPYLAYFQTKMRTPALDRYFAITANLGTHTFFMIFLPILFWCGWPGFGKG